MKIRILFVFILCHTGFKVIAQNSFSVKGQITDTSSHTLLVNTSISVLNAKDSTLRNFTRAASDGSFIINNKLDKGKFILLVTYPGYADYVEKFILDSVNHAHDFGKLNMILKAKLLADVIVKAAKAQIKIKGDTTEFNAGAFTVQPNAKVEDLLKQLPGIQVDKDGKITAQGETVNKVLVDGEEFFGDDPTLVTKNIRADMVDKVQLYDKKSDQATFTGIDDGQKTKTLNIKLKEDKKNGYFGKADVGYGTDDFYQAQLLFNLFKAKKKFSAYTTISNDGKTGLGWQDSQKLGASTNNIQENDGFIMFTNSGDDLDSFDGNYNGKGIPKAANSGLHYDAKWNNDKESINANVKSATLTVDGSDNTLSQNNLPTGGIINSTSDQSFHNYMFRNKLDFNYQLKLDTTSDLKITADGTTKHSTTQTAYAATSKLNDTLQTTNDRNITNQVDGKIFNASAFYTKKFKTKGRTFSWNVSEAYNESQAKGNLKTDINYYSKSLIPDSSQVVDQYKTNQLKGSLLTSNMTYTEPLSKTISLIVNYGISFNNSSTDRQSYNKAADGSYTLFDSTYSNFYKLNQVANQVGAIINYKSAKTTVNFGSKVSDVSFKQIDEYTGDEFKRHFINWMPQANFQYRISQRAGVGVTYNGKTTQPTVDQIQPVLVNTDPLNVITGNPALTPSFTNTFNFHYNSYKVLSDQFIFIGGNYSFTNSPIVNSTTTDSVGKSITQYINLGKTPYNYNIYSNFGRKMLGLNVGISVNANGSKNYNLSNGEVNAISSNTYTARFNVRKSVEKKYDFYFSSGPTLTYGGSSLQRNINNNGHGYRGDGGFTIYMPWHVSLSSDAEYQYNSATQTFNQDYSKFVVNGYLVKSFNKEETFKVTLICNDILNQNSGFSRSSSGNLITQDNYTTIKRFFMLTLVWDFNKMGGFTKK